MLQRNKGYFLRHKLGSWNLPAMVRKITLTNYKPPCLFSSVYSIRYFTAALLAHLNLHWCSRTAQDIQIILLIELQCFKVLPFSHVWIVLVVKLFGKTHSCRKKQTGLMGESCPVNQVMSFPVQLHACHKWWGVTGQLYCQSEFLLQTIQCVETNLVSVDGGVHTNTDTAGWP